MKRIYLPLFTLLLLAACAEDIATSNGFNSELTFSVGSAQLTPSGTITRSTPVKSDYEIPLYMIVTSEPVVDNMPTRGTEVTTASINASGSTIAVRAYNESGTVQSWCDGATATFNTTDKIFHTGIDWSNQSGNYDFYAWYPAASGNGLSVSGKTITYSIANLASSDMPDLLGATATSSYSAHHGKVDLTFSHLLTPVCFKLAANYGGGTIKSIKFSSLVTAATQDIGSGTWTTSTTGEYTTQTLSTTGSSAEVQVDGSQYFMMIPQTIAAGTVITITTQKGSGQLNTLTYTVPSGGFTWSAGEIVTYTISTTAITTLTATYPTWDDNGSTTYGPVDTYNTGESFGLFAVDASGKVVLSNVQISATSVSGQTATCDLTTGANATNLSDYILSQNYTYYLMYPYVSSLNESSIALGSSGHSSQTADQFFNSVKSSWSPAANQSTLSTYKSQDLQTAQVNASSYNAPMAHQMGLDCITLGTSTIVETRYFEADGTTFVKDEGTKTITASSSFVTNIPYFYDSNSKYYYIKNPNATVTFNSASTPDKDRWAASLTPTPTSGHLANATAQPYKNSTNTKDGRTGDYYYKGWVFEYNGSVQDFEAEQAGKYKLEVWGAQGGDGREWNHTAQVSGSGGNGGYTYGTYTVPNANYHLYVCIGGQGTWASSTYNSTNNTPPGGYNGGGNGGTETEPTPENAAGGGGATHIATSNRGILANYYSNQSEVLIVAGGGGGAAGNFMYAWTSIKEGYDTSIMDDYGLIGNPSKATIIEKIGKETDSFGFFDDARITQQNLIEDYFFYDKGFSGTWSTLTTQQKKDAIAYSVYKWYGGAGGGGANVDGATTYDYSYPGPATSGSTYTHDEVTYPLFGKGRDGYNVNQNNVGGTGGGGGGWYGGYHKDEHINPVAAGGAGGSSHVDSSLTDTGGEVGKNSGNGKAQIRSDFEWY